MKALCYNMSLNFLFEDLCVPTVVMRTKVFTFTVIANHKALHVSRNAEKNVETVAKTIASATNNVKLSPIFICFHRNFCLKNGTELDNDWNYR